KQLPVKRQVLSGEVAAHGGSLAAGQPCHLADLQSRLVTERLQRTGEVASGLDQVRIEVSRGRCTITHIPEISRPGRWFMQLRVSMRNRDLPPAALEPGRLSGLVRTLHQSSRVRLRPGRLRLGGRPARVSARRIPGRVPMLTGKMTKHTR